MTTWTTWPKQVSALLLITPSSVMDDVNMAYECLSNPEKREEYDEYLSSHTKMAGYQRRFERDNEDEEEVDSEEEQYTK